MFDRFVKFHIYLSTSGLNSSFGHLLKDLRGKNFLGGPKVVWVPNLCGQKNVRSKKCLDNKLGWSNILVVKLLGGA